MVYTGRNQNPIYLEKTMPHIDLLTYDFVLSHPTNQLLAPRLPLLFCDSPKVRVSL